MKLGLIGGTFNPIHFGHLLISEYIRSELNLDKIIFIPSGDPPHKNKKIITSSSHRLNMVKLAIENNPYFEASLIEIKREGKSYTVDTLKDFITQYPNDEIYFIIGADSLFQLATWRDFKTIAKLTKFILSGRPGFNEVDLYNKIEELNFLYDFDIKYVKIPLIEISSTIIRNNIKSNKSIKYLVTDKVEEYIYINNLYTQEDVDGY